MEGFVESNHCKQPFIIIQGLKPRAMTIRLIDPTTGDPLNLTGVTDVQIPFLNSDGTTLVANLTSGVSVLDYSIGKIMLQLTESQTVVLQPVNYATLQVSLSFGGDYSGCQIKNAYSVVLQQP